MGKNLQSPNNRQKWENELARKGVLEAAKVSKIVANKSAKIA